MPVFVYLLVFSITCPNVKICEIAELKMTAVQNQCIREKKCQYLDCQAQQAPAAI